MTREEAVNRLCDIYSGEFDVRLCEEHRKPLAAQMDFYAESSKYVLSKKAKLWEANSFEYVYLFNVPHLTKEIYDQCEKLAYDEEMCIRDSHHALMQSAASLKGLDAGLVKVATFTSVSVHWLPSILQSFGQRYPNIEFEVVTGDFYDQIEEWILRGTVDCGFLRLPSVKRLQTYALHRDKLQVIVPCGHPLADSDPFPLEALATEPFIRLEEGEDYEIVAAFDAMGIRPHVKYTAREDRTILSMVSKGLGISLLPELMVRHSPYPCLLYTSRCV